MRRIRILILGLALQAMLGPAGAADASLVTSGSFTAAAAGFMGCLRAADNTNSASVCVAAHTTPGGVRVVTKRFEPTPSVLAPSYFEEVTAPSSALSVTTAQGVKRVHLDVEMPRTGHIVVDVNPMWTTFTTQARYLQVNCGMSATAASDDGSAAVSPPSYDYGTVDGIPVVNADGCSFYWVAPASGSWAMAAPTDESPGNST